MSAQWLPRSSTARLVMAEICDAILAAPCWLSCPTQPRQSPCCRAWCWHQCRRRPEGCGSLTSASSAGIDAGVEPLHFNKRGLSVDDEPIFNHSEDTGSVAACGASARATSRPAMAQPGRESKTSRDRRQREGPGLWSAALVRDCAVPLATRFHPQNPAYVLVNLQEILRAGDGTISSQSRRLRSLVYPHNSSKQIMVGFAPAAPA